MNTAIPKEVISHWEDRADRIAKRLKRDVALFLEFKKRIAAAELMSYTVKTGRTLEDMTAPEAVLHFLGQLDCPVSLSKLREHMAFAGFPMNDRFGPSCRNFYVVIRRLARHGKIYKDGHEVNLVDVNEEEEKP